MDRRWTTQKTSRSGGMEYRVSLIRTSNYDPDLMFCPDFADHPITSRAHLLDIPAYLARHDQSPLKQLEASKISLSVLKGCVDDQHLVIRPGDVLIVHTGFTDAYLGCSDQERQALVDRDVRGWCGVEASEEMVRWHWECGFAAVATDT